MQDMKAVMKPSVSKSLLLLKLRRAKNGDWYCPVCHSHGSWVSAYTCPCYVAPIYDE